MAQTNSKFFSVMVVGNNPLELMDKYDKNKEVEPYVKYKYLDAKKYKSVAIKALEKIVSEGDKISLGTDIRDGIKERLRTLKTTSDFDYYRQLTDGLFYNENGDAISSENPDGQWVTCRNGGNFSIPLKLKDGSEVYSAKKGDVDWEEMDGVNKEIYRAAWEVVVEGREPENDDEKRIRDAMGDKLSYFENFKDKDDYVTYSTSYWNYAFVDSEGWHDMDNTFGGDERKWISEFYNEFVKDIDDDEIITIFECTTNND